ncbi:hypothetical protein BCR34DRAFT_573476 [Clohesyomyces aquaticus]|uniref:Uncharacterized protein n=1 Tax=Clohesyomyces aquaticus TaxID=1231657 RepID=A0A1Y1YZU5_9PLEO|nr:hypothetical protein BCR34DRAFT_573476 [Clohesyomyces aquaticus]
MYPPTPESYSSEPEDRNDSPYSESESIQNTISSWDHVTSQHRSSQLTKLAWGHWHEYPSPIPVFPKPLALSYCNYKTFYTEYKSIDGTRLEVASRLTAAMLVHYFPPPGFEHWRVTSRPDGLFENVPVHGTTCWMVTKRAPKPSEDGGGEVTEETASEPSPRLLLLLVIIITDNKYVEKCSRRAFQSIEFSSALIETSGDFVVDDVVVRKGNVAILGGRVRPIGPRFEFYTFDLDSEDGRALVPWFGESERCPEGYGTHAIGLGVEEAAKVDAVFKHFVSSELGTCIPNTNTLSSSMNHTAQLARAERSRHQSTELTPEPSDDDMTDEYLRSLKVNGNGRLLGAASRLLTSDKQAQAKRLARARGIQFAKPEFLNGRDRDRKQRERERERKRKAAKEETLAV